MAGASGDPGGPASPGAVLDDLQAAVRGLANDLYRVETEPELHALRDPSALTGTSTARLSRAAAEFSGVWARYSTLTDVLDRLAAGDRAGAAFVVPSTHDGEPMIRLCVVNPRTTVADVEALIASTREWGQTMRVSRSPQ